MMGNIVSLRVKSRTRWERFKTGLEAFGKVLLFFWHETFGYHDPCVTGTRFVRGRRLLSMECGCGAEWADLEAGEELHL
jgi:hypothetical protein